MKAYFYTLVILVVILLGLLVAKLTMPPPQIEFAPGELGLVTPSQEIKDGKLMLLWRPVKDASVYHILKSDTADGEFTKVAEVKDTTFAAAPPTSKMVFYRVLALGKK